MSVEDDSLHTKKLTSEKEWKFDDVFNNVTEIRDKYQIKRTWHYDRKESALNTIKKTELW